MSLTQVNNISSWNPQGACIERFMDNAAYTSAHPDDTLILVGPARHSSISALSSGSATGNIDNLTPIGMMQQMSVAQQRAVQPVQAIGSGRSYFLAGKPNVQFTIGRLFAKGNNLNRALYQNLVNSTTIKGFNPDEPATSNDYTEGAFNLDSELFLIPFGMCVLFRDKSGGNLGSFYIESCMIQSYNIGIASGQNVVMENVTGLADRIYPIDIATTGVGEFFSTGTDANKVEGTNTDFATGTLRTSEST